MLVNKSSLRNTSLRNSSFKKLQPSRLGRRNVLHSKQVKTQKDANVRLALKFLHAQKALGRTKSKAAFAVLPGFMKTTGRFKLNVFLISWRMHTLSKAFMVFSGIGGYAGTDIVQ